MKSQSTINLGTQIALIAMLSAALITLAGCSSETSSPPPSTNTPTATPTTAAGHYEDPAANFAITFPGAPSVEPIAGSESGQVRATYSTMADSTAPDAVFYIAGGTVTSVEEVTPDDLESSLFRLINQGIVLSGPERKFKLGGMPALMNDLTWTDGKPATIVVAGEGHRAYQLLVIGGSAEQRQSFFSSFELLKAPR